MKSYYILLLVVLFGCEKFVDVGAPRTAIVTEKVFSSNATANAAMIGLLSQMVNRNYEFMSYKLPLYTGMTGDEFRSYSKYGPAIQIYTNAIYPTNDLLAGFWNLMYNLIYQANAIIEGVAPSAGVTAEVKQQLTAEAKFIRAFLHFQLLNLYGDIPVITQTDYTVNAKAPRMPKADVYRQLIKDLTEAHEGLNAVYVGMDGIAQTEERVRPNKAAATALLARVHLYNGDWKDAETLSGTLIGDKINYALLKELDKVFLKESKEAIWSLQPSTLAAENPAEGSNFRLTQIPGEDLYNCVTLSETLMNAFENGDQRKLAWVSAFESYPYPAKYKATPQDGTREYSIVLRFSEQYLIRAEARAMQNKLSSARADLDSVRMRAGLLPTTAGTQAALLDAILKERSVEFFAEWGHRWFDLKRSGKADEVMPAATAAKGGVWKTEWQLYPIPQQERVNNENLTQNPGYN